MKLADVMTRNPVFLHPEHSVRDAAAIFRANGIDGAPVLDQHGNLVGLFTKSHLYEIMEQEKPATVLVGEVMTREVVTLEEGDDIDAIKDRMWGRYPVVRQNKLVGMVTKSDITSVINQQLKDISNEMKTVLNSAYNAIISIDVDSRIQIFNRAAERTFGLKQSEVVGKPYRDIFPEGPLTDIIRSGSTEKSQKFIFNHRTLVANRSPIVVDGKIVGAIAVAQDISDLEHITNELRSAKQQKEELDAILEASLDTVFVADADGRVVSVNEAYTKITGIKAEDILGKTMYELMEKGFYNRAATIMVLESKQPVSYTEKTQTGKTALFTGTPVFNKDGELTNVLVNIHDVTEIESISWELDRVRVLKEELDAVIQASFDGIFVTDGKAQVLSVNDAYLRMTGARREKLIGRSMYDLVAEGYCDRSASVMAIESRSQVTFTQRLKTGKGLLVTGNPIFNERGELIRVITNTRDLTELDRLKHEIEQAHGLRRHFQQELRRIQEYHGYIAESPVTRQIFDLIVRLAKVDSTVLIQGESGVGKEIVAQELHNHSLRREQPFIKVNCAAIPEALLESELFGYDSGAFTGAKKGGKMGIFELANRGTLFLDEVGELPLHLQAKLLRVLQENEFTRVGGETPIKVDVRVIAATNRNVHDMVRKNQFREDLYYRLNVVPIIVPPLRERQEEIPALADHFLNMFNRKYGLDKWLDETFMASLKEYSWPGNVRELRNVIERAVVTSSDPAIRAPLSPSKSPCYTEPAQGEPLPVINLKESVECFEKELLLKYVEKLGSSRRVASSLGTSQTTIWRKANQYGIQLSDTKPTKQT